MYFLNKNGNHASSLGGGALFCYLNILDVIMNKYHLNKLDVLQILLISSQHCQSNETLGLHRSSVSITFWITDLEQNLHFHYKLLNRKDLVKIDELKMKRVGGRFITHG